MLRQSAGDERQVQNRSPAPDAIEKSLIDAKDEDGPAFFALAMAQHKLGETEKARATYARAKAWWRTQSNFPFWRNDRTSAWRTEAEDVILTRPKATP